MSRSAKRAAATLLLVILAPPAFAERTLTARPEAAQRAGKAEGRAP
jgi:hypothetical protein